MRLTGADLAVAALRNHGVDTIFGLPGIQLDALFSALYDAGGKPRVVHFRHEQGAAYAALGFAQASGRAGVYTVVPGPGFLNTTAALATAQACGAPVLALIGQIETAAIGRGRGELHEISDQSGILRGLTKWSTLVSDPGQVSTAIGQAFHHLSHGRTGPVGIEIPPDVLAQSAPRPSHSLPVSSDVHVSQVDPEAVTTAAAILASARSPLIIVGGGALDAGHEIERLSDRLQAPIASHRQGRGVIASDRPYSLNLYETSRIWREADVVLAIGTRIQIQRKLWGLRPGQKLIHVDVDRVQMLRGGSPDIAIVAPARDAAAALLDVLERIGDPRPSIKESLVRLKAASTAQFDRRVGPQMAYVRALRAALPDETILVADYTQVAYVATAAFPVLAPRRLLTPGYQGTLGFGYATALGAQVSFPNSPVVALCGDGGFLFTAMELATAAQHGINVIAVVFNDSVFGNVQRMQRDVYGGKVIATHLRNPDFVRLAESFGIRGYRVGDPMALGVAMKEAVRAREPALIEVTMAADLPDPWPLLAPRLS